MTIYERGRSRDLAVIDEWEGGFGWLAHPHEHGRRASHAVDGPGGIWLLDPLWTPDAVETIDDRGDVAGVAVCFNWHARDADRFASRYDVPVTIPAWSGMDRAVDRLEAPVERVTGGLGESGFELRRCEPMPGWSEAFCYRERDDTLYVPESLATAPGYTVGDERLGTGVLRRLQPPRAHLRDLEPDRVLVGHGAGVLEDATRALEHALAVSRRRFPRALREHGVEQARALLAAMRSEGGCATTT
ncbi:hypothetical protein [Halopiger goleimassiliensis]|uniref:hypothetical protein n=1 Tax=Halopiger goleimassiliensis TaxID=1293048 RepID=UPI000677D4A8|nr:hypothetical protein [Halopiger goleimassiliensis]